MARQKSSKNETKYIPQEHEFGCAVAVIAMILGKTYEEVDKDFENDFNREGINLNLIIEYLGDAGYSIIHSYTTNYSDKNFAKKYLLTPFAPKHVVKVQPKIDSPQGHVIFMDGDGKIYDPSLEEGDVEDFYQITDVVGLFTSEDTEFFNK